MVHDLEKMLHGGVSAEINGRWVHARPCNWKYRSLRERFSDAVAVFKGTADAVSWPEGQ
jgi:hypothetical protein